MTNPATSPRKRVSLVIPMFNEGDAVGVLFARLDAVLPTLSAYDFEIVCVNDGSTDQTLALLSSASTTRKNLVVVDLSRNFGKEAALSAGLFIATGEAVIPMDADLQDPPEAIKDLLAKWEDGFEVVLARRADRSSDSMAKRFTAQSFYRIHNAVADVEIPADVGDFRLMDRVVVEALNALPEGRRFMKGLFAWVGFKTTSIDYHRDARAAGTSKFNAWKLWNFALEGIFSFSISPLKIWTYLGFFVALGAVGWGAWIALRTLVWGVDVPGYASVLVGVLLLGGLQLIGIGMIGEYLGRAFLESKRRPAYLIRQILRTTVSTPPASALRSDEAVVGHAPQHPEQSLKNAKQPSLLDRISLAKVAVLFVLVAACLQWSIFTIPGYFSHDDLQWLFFASNPPESWSLFTFFADVKAFQYRPLTFTVWLWIGHIFGDSAVAMHVVRGVMGTLSAGLMAWLINRLGASRLLSMIAAIVFLFTPSATYTHAWIGTYADELCMLFLLIIALWLTRSNARLVTTAALTFIATALALLSKESAIVFPAILAIVWFVRRAQGGTRNDMAAMLASAGAVIIYLAVRIDVILFPKAQVGGYTWSLVDIPLRLFDYAVMPFALNQFEGHIRFERPMAWIAIALCFMFLYTVLRAGPRWLLLLLLAFSCALGPVLILPFAAHHYAYLATAVAAVITALAWRDMGRVSRGIAAATLLAVVIHGGQTIRTMSRIGSIQSQLFSELVVKIKAGESNIVVRAENYGDEWVVNRLLHDVPSFKGVPIREHVRAATSGQIAVDGTHLMDRQGHLTSLPR